MTHIIFVNEQLAVDEGSVIPNVILVPMNTQTKRRTGIVVKSLYHSAQENTSVAFGCRRALLNHIEVDVNSLKQEPSRSFDSVADLQPDNHSIIDMLCFIIESPRHGLEGNHTSGSRFTPIHQCLSCHVPL